MPPGTFLRRPIVPPAAMGEVNWLKTAVAGRRGGALWFADDYFLCANDVAARRMWEYAPERRRVVEITSRIPDLARRHCESIRGDAPLTAEFDYRDGTLFWRFGPYVDGNWRVLIANGVQAFDVPRTDAFRLPDIPGIALRIRYDSPEGWTAYSPEMVLDFERRPRRRFAFNAPG